MGRVVVAVAADGDEKREKEGGERWRDNRALTQPRGRKNLADLRPHHPSPISR
jgi:hypothetical protein